MRTIKATDRQTIIDLAIQYYGTAASVIDLCIDNGWELDHNVQPGDMVLLQDAYPGSADGNVADYIQSNSIAVVSSYTAAADFDEGDFVITPGGDYIITNDGDFIILSGDRLTTLSGDYIITNDNNFITV